MPLFPNSHLSLESVLGVLSWNSQGGDCKVMIYKDVVCWLLFCAKFDCNFIQYLYLQSEACALHITGIRRVSIGWRQLCLASILRVRLSRETPAKHSVLPVCTIRYTLSLPTLYIPILPTNDVESF